MGLVWGRNDDQDGNRLPPMSCLSKPRCSRQLFIRLRARLWGRKMDEWATGSVKNMFGQVIKMIQEMYRLHAAGAVHGSLYRVPLIIVLIRLPRFAVSDSEYMYKLLNSLPGVFMLRPRPGCHQYHVATGRSARRQRSLPTGFCHAC